MKARGRAWEVKARAWDVIDRAWEVRGKAWEVRGRAWRSWWPVGPWSPEVDLGSQRWALEGGSVPGRPEVYIKGQISTSEARFLPV